MQTNSKDSRIRTYPAQRGIFTPSLTSNSLVLIQRWRRSIQLKRRSWQSDALFRSLAVAFRAARLPKGSDNELFDLGIQLSLWVSAHECLAHPGRKGKADLQQVLTLLARRYWLFPSLRRKSRLRRVSMRLNQVQKMYVRMYRSRTAFLPSRAAGRPNQLTPSLGDS